MKKIMFVFSLITLVGISHSFSQRAVTDPANPEVVTTKTDRSAATTPEQFAERLTARIQMQIKDLSAEQLEQIQAVNLESATKTQKIRTESKDRTEVQQAFVAARKERFAKYKEVLTEEQAKLLRSPQGAK
jgi:hypothetical protein